MPARNTLRDGMRFHALWTAGVILCLVLCGPVRAQSGFYRYVDEGGQVRYTDNPANIPPDQYRGLMSEVPLHESATDPAPDAVSASGAQRIVVNYDAGGGAIMVHGVLNRQYPVLFILDTGATNTMITETDVRMLGLSIDGVRRIKGLIADGSIVDMPLVRLGSIDVGEAQVKNIDVAVGAMRLLGLDFLGNFDMNINAQAAQLVLVPKDHAPGPRSIQREAESEMVRMDREQAKRDIDNQISQLRLAITTRVSTIQQYHDEIHEAETHRLKAEASLSSLISQGRFEGSGVSRDQTRASMINSVEKNIEDIDAYIQNRRDNIALQEQQIAGMQERIKHLRELRRRIN